MLHRYHLIDEGSQPVEACMLLERFPNRLYLSETWDSMEFGGRKVVEHPEAIRLIPKPLSPALHPSFMASALRVTPYILSFASEGRVTRY